MKVTIIDLSRTDEIKILHARITGSVTVESGYYLTLAAGDDPVRIAALKLKEEGLSDLPAIIIPSGELVEKHIFYLPKMPDKDIRKVLPREIAGVKDSSMPFVFNYINNGFVEERQLEKMEIAAFFSVKERIFEFLNRLKAEGINPIKIIPEAQGLKNLLEMNPGLLASIIKADYFRGKVSMPAHLREAREFISLFTLPIATAVAVSTKKYLELLPEEYKEKSQLPTRLIGLGVSAAIIVAILIGSTIYFQDIKGSYEKDIRDIQQTYLSLNKNAAIMEETKHKRADFYKRRYYIDYPLKYSYAAANFVRRLTLIPTGGIEITEVEINPASQSLTFLLHGKIKAENNIDVQSRFLEFYRELKQFEDIIRIESSKVNVNPGENKPGMPGKRHSARAEPEEKQVELYFTINGEIDTDME